MRLASSLALCTFLFLASCSSPPDAPPPASVLPPPTEDAGPPVDPCADMLDAIPDGYVLNTGYGETAWSIDAKGAAFVLTAISGADQLRVGPADGPFHTVYTAPTDLAIIGILPDTTSIYLVIGRGSDHYAIVRVPRGGGAATVMYQAPANTYLGSLLADGANLLFASIDDTGSSIEVMPKSGGAPEEVVRRDIISLGNLRLESGVLYWVESGRSLVRDEVIRSMPRAGGDPVLFANLQLPSYVNNLLVSKGVAFVSREAYDGELGEPHLYRISRNSTASAIDPGGFGPFVIDGARIYRAEQSGITSIAIDGSDESSLVQTREPVGALVATSGAVYYALAKCILKTSK